MAEVKVTAERDEERGTASYTATMTGFTQVGIESLKLVVGLVELAMGPARPVAAMTALADAEWLDGFADAMEGDTDGGKAHPDPATVTRLRRIAAGLRASTEPADPGDPTPESAPPTQSPTGRET